MSVLLVGATGDLAVSLITRLVSEGDEVRVVEDEGARAEQWRALGAFVARGSSSDADLVERAAQNVRTIVVVGHDEDIEPVLRGAVAARVERIVRCAVGRALDAGGLNDGGVDYIVLNVPARGRWRGAPRVSWEAVAAAIDAADDLAGAPRLVLDLGRDEGWRALGLRAPETRA